MDTTTDETAGKERQSEDEIDVKDAGLHEHLPLEKLRWGNIFQEKDAVVIKKQKAASLAAATDISEKSGRQFGGERIDVISFLRERCRFWMRTVTIFSEENIGLPEKIILFDKPDGKADVSWLDSLATAITETIYNAARGRGDVFGGVSGIDFRVYPEGNEAVFEIRDKGPGIAEEIWEEFLEWKEGKRTGALSSPKKTAGIGLQMSCETVAGLGGRVEIETKRKEEFGKESGTTVKFIFPGKIDGESQSRPEGVLRREEKKLYDENDSEESLLIRASRNMEKHPVNMHIDLTVIPKDIKQLEQNMDTLAHLIAWHDTFGLNVRYVLENDTDGQALEILKGKLKNELVSCVGSPYVAGETIETQDGETIRVKEDELIDIRLENTASIKKNRIINDREYIVALKDDTSRPGIAIPNYTAAAAMGLSLAALRVARDKLEKQPDMQMEYEQFRGKILDKFRDIYERYNVITNGNGFSEDELELMVMGSSATKLYYTVLYALPPVVKVIERIHKYHEIMHDILKAA